ncbi:hypothetical protein PFISCL1PPCAC_4044, partial [Pristionchus fissidentatus]
RRLVHVALAAVFIYISIDQAIAGVKDDATDSLTTEFDNMTDWLIEMCGKFNSSDEEPTHANARNLTLAETSKFHFDGAEKGTAYINSILHPMCQGLLHGLIDAYSDFKNDGKTADDFMQPCNCTVLLTLGQFRNVSSSNITECMDITLAKF